MGRVQHGRGGLGLSSSPTWHKAAPAQWRKLVVNEEQPPRKGIKTKTRLGQLEATRDWKMLPDVGQWLIFPPEIATINHRPDIVLWSRAARPVHLAELKVPLEDAMDEAYDRKKLQYA
ncbi:UNVERIFIED_CONTAM: hypothetical protein FKN15_066224 [Acipenser sinensis]